jgi:ABC-type glycerol-3-phosphate transport system permease component
MTVDIILKHRTSPRQVMARTLTYVALSAGALLCLIPLYWSFICSLRPAGWELTFPPKWIPEYFLWENYVKAWQSGPFLTYTENSLTVTLLGTIGSLMTSSISAFGFSRLHFKSRDFIFAIILSTMMLPSWVTIIPQFVLYKELRWIDTLYPLWVPGWFGGGAFYIFMMRQFYMTLPVEMEEAARVDGASTLRIFLQIILPLTGPVMASVAIFSFIHYWNDFMGPLIFTNKIDHRTLALGLRYFRNEHTTSINLMMCASMFMVIPVLLLFFAAQRYFVKGVVTSGLAGR